MARAHVVWSNRTEFRHALRADTLGARAARPEDAPGRWLDRAGDVSLEADARAPPPGIGHRHAEYLKHNQIIPETGLAYHQIGDLKLDFIFSREEIKDAIKPPARDPVHWLCANGMANLVSTLQTDMEEVRKQLQYIQSLLLSVRR